MRYRGGYWLPSMGVNADGVPDIVREGVDLRRAISEILAVSWQLDVNDRTVKSESIGGAAPVSTIYENNIAILKSAERILRGLAPIVA